MVRLTRRAMMIGMTATMVLPVATTFAQEESSGSETGALLAQLPGLEAAWAKRYDTPERYEHLPSQATPEPVTVSTEQLSITILVFDGETNAALSFAVGLTSETAAMVLGVEPEDLGAAQEVEMGDQASLFVTGEGRQAAALLAIQAGNLGYLITAWGPDDDVIRSVEAVGEFMVNAEPGVGEIVFTGPADSTGGVFDLFPPRDDPSLLGLIPMYEYDLLGSDRPLEHHDHPATPASSS